MFDIGFWEIMLISVIGLVVLGPQRLPIAIKSVVKWVNTAKNMANSVKKEISQELDLHEMNENMIKATKQGLDTIDPDLKASIDEMKSNVKDLTRPYEYDGDEAIQPHHIDPIPSEVTAEAEQAPSSITDKTVLDAKSETNQTKPSPEKISEQEK